MIKGIILTACRFSAYNAQEGRPIGGRLGTLRCHASYACLTLFELAQYPVKQGVIP